MSKTPSQSMIELTQKVIKADYASKKNKLITLRAIKYSGFFLTPIFMWSIYVIKNDLIY